MKSMVLEEFEAPLVPEERDEPTPGAGEAVLKVGACGVCQTDLKVWQGKHPAAGKLPLIMGHEVAGVIAAVGEDVEKDFLGRRAIVYAYDVCGTCEFCRAGRHSLCSNRKGNIGMSMDGGYAEYVKVPAHCLFPISETIPFEKAAILTDAVATPYHALVSKAKIREGETVAVIGVGGLGLHAVQIAAEIGAKTVAVDVKEASLALALKMGAEWTVNPNAEDAVKRIMALTGKNGVDAVIELTGNPKAASLGLEILRTAGRFVLVAYSMTDPFLVKSFLMVSKELEIYGSRWCGRDDFAKCIDLVSQSKVDPFVGEVHPLSEANQVLSRLQRGEILGRAVLVP